MIVTLNHTDSSNPDFISLVTLLDADLKVTDGEDHDFYKQFNAVDKIKYCIVAYEVKLAVGCGAIKIFDATTMEIKRMFVLQTHRGKGIASKILSELEILSSTLGFSKCILETGINQHQAIALYHKCNYQIIENYAQYKGAEKSICFEKILTNH